MCTRFEKKISDLDLTRTIAMQTAPQIRLVQNNEVTMVEKIQTTIVNTIPLWKSQMVLALGIANSAEAVRAQNAVTNMTNDLLKKNAEMLHTSTVEVARANPSAASSISRPSKTLTRRCIKTFDEVMQIQQEGRRSAPRPKRKCAVWKPSSSRRCSRLPAPSVNGERELCQRSRMPSEEPLLYLAHLSRAHPGRCAGR